MYANNDMPGFQVEVEDEDLVIREAVKQAAYSFESHGNPEFFQNHIDEILEGSRSRYRAIFEKYGYGKSKKD